MYLQNPSNHFHLISVEKSEVLDVMAGSVKRAEAPLSSQPYLIFVVFFTRTKFLENKIYTEKTRKLRQNTQKIANFFALLRQNTQ